jgi:hypothetical protein
MGTTSMRRILDPMLRTRRPLVAVLACAAWLACTVDPEAAGPEGIPSGNPNGKDDGGECSKGFDCKSGVCTSSTCAVSTPTDGVRNGDETGLDCGGKEAPLCNGGQPCLVGTDCKSGECVDTKCTGDANAPPPTGDDGKKNGDETDVDCGGTKTNAPRCGTDKGCSAAEDCESKVCSDDKKCLAATATDKVQNGDETDVDCGGKTTSAPKCEAGKSCVAHDDCASNGCDDQKKCAVGRSCTALNGGRTCGTGEVGEADAKHESCCGALPIPGTAGKLDKYKVTSGRMRAFVERVNGNVAGWYNENKGSLSAKAVAQIEPFTGDLPTDLVEVHNHLGGTALLPDRPGATQGCFTGSAANPANGAHTYWTPDAPGLPAEDREDRAFDQAFLDRLPLNCVPFPILAAFCAWDGGRVQTWEENSKAYGPGFYPWGNAPETYGFDDAAGVWQEFGPAATRPGAGAPAPAPGADTTRMNWHYNYQFPEGGNAAKPWDYAYFISAPGRFPLDKGVNGHMDLGGIMMELTASPGINQPSGDPAIDPKYGAKVRWSRAGSFEVHQANYQQWQFAVLTKYGKQGGRCARD